MKRCPRCGQTLDESAFGRNRSNSDGLQSWCRECTKIYFRGHRERYRERNAQTQRERRKAGPGREADRKWRATHYEHYLTLRRPRERLYYAMRIGLVQKGVACERCGKTGDLHGHHSDYSRPLDVQWLCPLCHMAVHKELRSTQQEGV